MLLFFHDLFIRLTRVGSSPHDSEDVRLQKRLLIITILLIMPAAISWGGIYMAFDEPLAAMIPWLYVVLSVVSIAAFGWHKRLDFFRFTQLFLMLLLPFLLQLTLGGFVSSSGVVLWSLICPFGALVFAGPRPAVRWFLAYLCLVVIGGVLDQRWRAGNNLPLPVITAFFVLNISAISLIAFTLLHLFMGQKDTALRMLRAEQEKSESLLLNILPREIAAILKNRPGTIADQYECASILFADIVNFTPWSAELPPNEMVEMLNEVFTYFDSLVDRYGVEKIRTIGDNYMVASGVPVPRPDHAQALARMALDMCSYISQRPPRNGKRLDFRIGINSGQVVAGVIGKKKFVYDLWGDPVNIAARMESQGEPGKIQIGEATYELIKDEFECAPRGKVFIKGKGEMQTYYVIGAKAN